MRTYTLLFILAALCCVSAAGAYTVTFDEVAAGTDPQQYIYTGTPFYSTFPFTIEDHSTATWGVPHSGTNVMVCLSDHGTITLVGPPPDAAYGGTPIHASVFGAYFSTTLGTEVTMTMYHFGNVSPLASLTIGSPNEAWSNRYVSYACPAGDDIYDIRFAVSRLGAYSSVTPGYFCLDDMTITPVPEPSSLAALICGLAGVGGFVMRRRRK